MRKTLLALCIAGLGSMGATALVDAGTLGTSMPVTAEVIPVCTAISNSGLSFGPIRVDSTATFPAGGTISVTCPYGMAYTLTHNGGLNYAGTSPRMKLPGPVSGSDLFLPYTLYKDSICVAPWAKSTAALLPEEKYDGSGIAGGGSDPKPVCATTSLPAGTMTGSYSDTVEITLTF